MAVPSATSNETYAKTIDILAEWPYGMLKSVKITMHVLCTPQKERCNCLMRCQTFCTFCFSGDSLLASARHTICRQTITEEQQVLKYIKTSLQCTLIQWSLPVMLTLSSDQQPGNLETMPYI